MSNMVNGEIFKMVTYRYEPLLTPENKKELYVRGQLA